MSNQRGLFLSHIAQTSPAPLMLEIDRAEGAYLYDPEGKPYLDLISGIGVSCLGHRHPAVISAAKEQLDRYLHTLVYGEFVLSPQVRLAGLLADNLPAQLNNVYFVNSGTEATEGAMKLAKRYTGRPEIIASYNAYHGSTQGSASLMNPTEFTQGYHPLLPGIRHIRFNQAEDLVNINNNTAAVIVETVQAECGLQAPAGNYLRLLRDRCSETGTLLILDEIQAGFGRTGSLWAFQQYGIVPDILLLGKAMGGGMPIAAFIADKPVMSVIAHDPVLGHITTFGGHPVACAAAYANLSTLIDSGLIEQVKTKERLFLSRLRHPAVKAVRSAGLWLALEFEGFDFLQAVIRNCLPRGLIPDWFLFNSRSMRIGPPLTITIEEIEWACSVIIESIDAVAFS
ncbi:MAG TPA: aspartate aminotransferase family protein [Flavilitoribacter sp.]|nr:aspartate aminotransferase family protein [Flavilitoribacter sp.]